MKYLLIAIPTLFLSLSLAQAEQRYQPSAMEVIHKASYGESLLTERIQKSAYFTATSFEDGVVLTSLDMNLHTEFFGGTRITKRVEKNCKEIVYAEGQTEDTRNFIIFENYRPPIVDSNCRGRNLDKKSVLTIVMVEKRTGRTSTSLFESK